ncbi:alkylphosphonate utilization protein [Helicobacter kayseriensis]|uniref:alkylphosphonate utilization protein n=1 Tax=Helicobacter kayseriensis TaxID=2905877 RepID=UPI001E3CBB45|nr:alkylphosphonate utilization protein [Helicobacter kayseriensis]MCE3046778.1 alkylphosphonate utilization protein [Helicobacter kayseriensis]MCE3047920.1 alkylphosphonate utilization protein [Helicobacter kayseriensis]
MNVKDCNGNILKAGDNVQVIKDLKVKGSSLTLKRGAIVKNIRLTEKEDEIEGKVDKSGIIVLKTCFLKKA